MDDDRNELVDAAGTPIRRPERLFRRALRGLTTHTKVVTLSIAGILAVVGGIAANIEKINGLISRVPPDRNTLSVNPSYDIDEVKRRLSSLQTSGMSASTEYVTVTFVSKKWGYQFDISPPAHMECGALTSLLVDGLGLPKTLDMPGLREDPLPIRWYIATSQRVCDPRQTLKQSGIITGDEIHLSAQLPEPEMHYHHMASTAVENETLLHVTIRNSSRQRHLTIA